jgi:hypothetical protein
MPAQPVRQARPSERGLDQHTANFIDCVRTRSAPRCDVATGSLAAVNAHLGNIALRTGDTLNWDAARAHFTGDRNAQRYLAPGYRSPWKLPSG